MDTSTQGQETQILPTTSCGSPPKKQYGSAPLGTPRPVDVHVGMRLRQRRTLLGMSQEKLGTAVELTFQQIQKYERGANRIGASRLYQLAGILDVEISYFFEDMPGDVQKTRGGHANAQQMQLTEKPTDHMARRETLELVRAYYRIEDPKVRKRIFELTKSVAKDEPNRGFAATALGNKNGEV